MTRKVLAVATLLALAPLSAHATIAKAMKFEDKVENAASIIVGECVAQQSQWDAAKSWILTYSTFRIESTLKGQPAQEITLVTPGGQVGTVAQEVIGVPQFKKGEQNVVFVRNSKSGPTVLYLEQGNYRVSKNERGERIVTPAVSSSVLVDTGRGVAVTPEEPRTLRDFERAVTERVRRGEVQRMEMMAAKKKAEDRSFWSVVQRNKALVALALLGALLATWQLTRRG
jgi:hypothetical protein